MTGFRHRIFGSTGSSRLMASDDSRGGLPPLPIVDNTSVMMKNLDAERQRVARKEVESCIILSRPNNLQGEENPTLIVEAVGKLLSYSLRPYDSLYRFGGDMFLVVLSQIKAEDITVVMNRLRGVVTDDILSLTDGGATLTTASFGGIMLDGDISVEGNLDRAGIALHAAFYDGGNAVCVWSPELGAERNNGRAVGNG